MAHDEPLRISCEGCPGGAACDGCLVHFFLADRDAEVVSFNPSSTPSQPTQPLEAELQRVLALLDVAGLQPELLAVRPSRAARAS